jgi:aspartyl/glutamyl-tRNA(Asn/Gln) amidotransferase C subunit
MPISQADIEKVAQLAHLELRAEELKTFGSQIADIINYVEQLNELDTSNVEPAIGGLTPEGERTNSPARRRDPRLTGPTDRPRRSPRRRSGPLPRTKSAVKYTLTLNNV